METKEIKELDATKIRVVNMPISQIFNSISVTSATLPTEVKQDEFIRDDFFAALGKVSTPLQPDPEKKETKV